MFRTCKNGLTAEIAETFFSFLCDLGVLGGSGFRSRALLRLLGDIQQHADAGEGDEE